jgi:hypothetical protein
MSPNINRTVNKSVWFLKSAREGIVDTAIPPHAANRIGNRPTAAATARKSLCVGGSSILAGLRRELVAVVTNEGKEMLYVVTARTCNVAPPSS